MVNDGINEGEVESSAGLLLGTDAGCAPMLWTRVARTSIWRCRWSKVAIHSPKAPVEGAGCCVGKGATVAVAVVNTGGAAEDRAGGAAENRASAAQGCVPSGVEMGMAA